MRIAWFTPFNRRSAIARYSRLVVEALAAHVDVDLLLPAGTPGEELETSARIVRYDLRTLPALLDSYDVSIFNMGDSAYHLSVWDALQSAHANLHPAVAVMHDCFYLDLLYHHAWQAGDTERFGQQLEAHYGRTGRRDVEALLQRRASLADLQPYPMHQPILAAADGFIVHSRFCRERLGLRDADNVLELFIPLEYAAPTAAEAQPAPPGAARLALLTVGIGNRNKHLHVILEALASDAALARSVSYTASGTIAPGYLAELEAYVRRHDLRDVRFPGYASDSELAMLLQRADICINLRQPCLEGGSATLVEILASAKPVVVYDDGVYAEIPDDCAVKVSPHGGAKGIARALRGLVKDDARRLAMGRAAAAFVQREWRLERYVASLVAHLDAHRARWAVQAAAREAARRAHREVGNLGLRHPVHARMLADHLGRWAS